MLPNKDLKAFLRDLVYLEETAYNLSRETDLPAHVAERIRDNISEKQVILGRIMSLIV